MSQSSLFTRLLCTGAVGLFGLTAFGSDQTTAANSQNAQQSVNPISTSSSAAASMQTKRVVVQTTEKIDPAVAAKQLMIAKGVLPPPPPQGGPAPRSVNDNCADAVQINCGDTVTSNNAGDTLDGTWTCGFNVGSDEWFSFVAGDPVATVSLCGSAFDTVIMILDGCAGTNLGCVDDFCGLQSQITVSNLTVGNTYLIGVGGYNGAVGDFTLNLTCGTPTCDGSNAQPGDIEEGEVFDCGLTDTVNGGCNSTPPVYSAIACGQSVHGMSGTNDGAGSRDTDWWLFNVDAPGAVVTWTVTANFPALIGFVGATCPGNFISGTAVTGPACTEFSTTSACLPPGQYVAFIAPSVFAGVVCGSEYRGTLSCVTCEPPPAPANDLCANAIGINCGDTISSNNVNAGTDGGWTCAAGGSDVWYSFVAADPVATVSTCGSALDTAIMIVDGCGGTILGCNDDFCGLQSQLSVGGLTVGNTYLIAIGGFAAGQGDFTMTLTCGVPTCDGSNAQPGDIEEGEVFDCGLTDTVNGGCNSTPPVYSPIACGQSVHGTSGTNEGAGSRDTDWWLFNVDAPGAVVTWTVTANFPALIGFVPGTCPAPGFIGTPVTGDTCTEISTTSACLPPGQYVAFVAPSGFTGVICGSEYRGTLSCVTCEPPPPPANDDCANAIQINCGDTVNGDNTNATSDGLQPSCSFGGAPTNSDLWYSFVADSPNATVSLCGGGSIPDTNLAVYDGCGGSEIACNDDFCGLLSQVDVAGMTPGNTYYIRVAGWNATAQGTFTLSLTNCGATGACCVSGNCSVMSPSACAAAGGSYQGDGTDCGGVNYTGSTCGEGLEDISATGTIAATASNCDDCGESVALPFNFTFFGNTYSSVNVCSNGYLTFGATTGDFSNDAIPNAALPNDIICPFWDDFNTTIGSGDIYTEARTSPDRFIVQWNRVVHFGGTTGENTFQAILYADGNIDLRQGSMDATFGNTGTIGIENSDGTAGLSFGASPNDPGTSGACNHVEAESTGDPCNQACTGDLDHDGDRDIADLAALLSQFGSTGTGLVGDIDGDGDVDIGDLAALLSVFGVPC